MVTATKEQSFILSRVQAVADRFSQRRTWTHCPRCIGGNMYYSGDGEYVCMQCGCSYNAAKSPQTTKMDVSLNRELNSILHSAHK
jgi:tRNA(Ile2) C34 agmatinyltransferase TiaS